MFDVYGLGYPWSIPLNLIYSLLIKKGLEITIGEGIMINPSDKDQPLGQWLDKIQEDWDSVTDGRYTLLYMFEGVIT